MDPITFAIKKGIYVWHLYSWLLQQQSYYIDNGQSNVEPKQALFFPQEPNQYPQGITNNKEVMMQI